MDSLNQAAIERVAELAAEFVAAHESRYPGFTGVTPNERSAFYVLLGAMNAAATRGTVAA